MAKSFFVPTVLLWVSFFALSPQLKADSNKAVKKQRLFLRILMSSNVPHKVKDNLVKDVKSLINKEYANEYSVVSEADLEENLKKIVNQQKNGVDSENVIKGLLEESNADEIIHGKIFYNFKDDDLGIALTNIEKDETLGFKVKSSVAVGIELRLDKDDAFKKYNLAISDVVHKLLRPQYQMPGYNPLPFERPTILNFDKLNEFICSKEESVSSCSQKKSQILTELYECTRSLIEEHKGKEFLINAKKVFELAQDPKTVPDALKECNNFSKTKSMLVADEKFIFSANSVSYSGNEVSEVKDLAEQSLAFIKGILAPMMECKSTRVFASAGWMFVFGTTVTKVNCVASNSREYAGVGMGVQFGIGGGVAMGYKVLKIPKETLTQAASNTSSGRIQTCCDLGLLFFGKVTKSRLDNDAEKPNRINVKSSGVFGLVDAYLDDYSLEIPILPYGTDWMLAYHSLYSWSHSYNTKMSAKPKENSDKKTFDVLFPQQSATL